MNKSILFSFLTILLCLNLQAQFEGKVVYSVSYEAVDPSKSQMLSMLPDESVLTVKGDLSLFEQKVAGGGKQAFIVDASAGSGILVMQFLGQEYKVEMSKAEIETLKQTRKLKIHKTDERKTIAGEHCLGALATSETDTLQVFYAEKINSSASFPPFADIEGLPMEYELIRGGIKMKYSAQTILREKIDDSVFTTDPQMKSVKFEDFAKSFAITQ